jgi:hypothetical protein
MTDTKLTTPYDAMDVREMPSVVPASPEQSQYVVSLAKSVIGVLLQKSTLDDEERAAFGKGEFFWPKDPKKPIRTSKSYDSSNFRINFVTLSFARQSEDTPWTGAALSINPKAFPRSSYKFVIPTEFFAGMTLVRAYSEERAANGSSPARKVNIFEYSLVDKDIRLSLQFEARADLTDLKEPRPSTFDLLKVKRN